MESMKRWATLLIMGALVVQFCTPYAYAYLDPGTGSIILQVLIGSIVGCIFVVKVFWHRMKNAVLGLFDKSESTTSDE